MSTSSVFALDSRVRSRSARRRGPKTGPKSPPSLHHPGGPSSQGWNDGTLTAREKAIVFFFFRGKATSVGWLGSLSRYNYTNNPKENLPRKMPGTPGLRRKCPHDKSFSKGSPVPGIAAWPSQRESKSVGAKYRNMLKRGNEAEEEFFSVGSALRTFPFPTPFQRRSTHLETFLTSEAVSGKRSFAPCKSPQGVP